MRWIIDTDAGVDDAIAMGIPFAPGKTYGFTLEAVTTVAGNVSVDKVNRNVGTLLDLLGLDVPIYAGCDRPLIAKRETAEDFHGEDGLGGNGLSKSTRKPEAEHAAPAIVRLAQQYEGEISLLALAPLTNIALACNLDPDLPKRFKKIVLMGGAWQAMGNQSSAAEFNIAVDPESAHVVFERFRNIVLVPWETAVAHEWPFERIASLAHRRTVRGIFLWKMCEHIIPKIRDFFSHDGFPLPDPMTVAIALDETLITSAIEAFVRVDVGHHHGRGLTTLVRRHPQPNVRVVTGVNEKRFFEMMEAAWR
jgi:purine nucleosidase